MQIEIDMESAYKLMEEIIISDIQMYTEELEDVNLLEFFGMSQVDQEDAIDSYETLVLLKLIAAKYCRDDWESKI